MKWVWRICFAVVLTVTTAVGGLAYLISFLFRRRFVSFIVVYAALSVGLLYLAPRFDRVPLACVPEPGRLSVQSPIYCMTNRHYVSPDLRLLADDIATVFPKARALDGGFPLPDGIPLLPHLGHNNGKQLDIAFAYHGTQPFGIGYWHFVDGPTECPSRLVSLRWDLKWLDWARRDIEVDVDTTTAMLRWMTFEPRISRIFLEPHLKKTWGLESNKIRFQGCNAARHDDHIHIEM